MFKRWQQTEEINEKFIVNNNDKKQLDDLKIDESGEVVFVPNSPLLEALGFRVGKNIILRAKSCFDGPLVAEVDGRFSAISKSVAEKIILK